MVVVWGLAVTLLVTGLDQAEAGLHERRLLNDLFMYHDPRERPVRNESDSVQMQLGVKWVAAVCRAQCWQLTVVQFAADRGPGREEPDPDEQHLAVPLLE